MTWRQDDLAFALGEEDAHKALAVAAAAEHARHAVVHLAPELRAAALAAALADEVGEPTAHRWGRIGAAALENIITPEPARPPAVVSYSRAAKAASLQGRLV
jgi:hypothetical protein